MRVSRNYVLVLAAVLVMALPLVLHPRPREGALFTGADGQAKDAIAILAPGYQPWIQSPWKPPSGEVESLLFALQAALGAGFIGYHFGVRRERLRRDGDSSRC